MRLGLRGERGHQRVGPRHPFAGPLPPAADRRQAQAQVFEQVAVHGEVGAGARIDHAAPAPYVANSRAASTNCCSGMSARSATYSGVNPDTAAARSSKPSTFSSRNCRVTEPLSDDDVDDPRQDGDVFARPGLNVNRCARGGLRPAGIDDDQFHAAASARLRFCAGFCPGNTDRLGHQRVGADQHPAVGLVEVDVAA